MLRKTLLVALSVLSFNQVAKSETTTLDYISYPFIIVGGMYGVSYLHEVGHYIAHVATGAENPRISIGPSPVDGHVENSDSEPPSGSAAYFRGVAGPLFTNAVWEMTDYGMDAYGKSGTTLARAGGWFYLGNRVLTVVQLTLGWLGSGDFYSAHVSSGLMNDTAHYGTMIAITALYALEFYLNSDDIEQSWNRFIGASASSTAKNFKFHILPGSILFSYRF